MLDTVVYRPSASTKNAALFDALVKGFRGRMSARVEPMEVGRYRSARLHVVAGLQFGALERLQAIRASGEPYVFVDRAYFGGGPGSGRYRLTHNAYQQHWVRRAAAAAAGARLAAWGVHVAPWRAPAGPQGHVLLIPPGAAICRLFGLGDWEAQTLARLKRCTARPVVVSYKGDPKPLSRRLDGCHAVVTWTSNVAVEAVCAGVPVFCSRESAAAPVGLPLGELEARLETPRLPGLPDERARWAASLACGQFTLAEIAGGLAAFQTEGILEAIA